MMIVGVRGARKYTLKALGASGLPGFFRRDACVTLSVVMTGGCPVVKESIDAIVLAGDRAASNNFAGRNKLFLEVNGLPLLLHVLSALDDVARVERVFIVGPATDIEALLSGSDARLDSHTPIHILEQRNTAYENFWSAFTGAIDDYTPGAEKQSPAVAEKVVLVVPSDMPLVSAAEIDEFLDHCDVRHLDYCIGATAERNMRRFLPTEDQPGIEMSYLHLDCASLRLNNLHLIRPFSVQHRDYIERAYELRYQKKFFNVAMVIWEMFRIPGFGGKAISTYCYYQLSMLFRALGWTKPFRHTRGKVTRAKVTHLACMLLGARVGIVETTIGGCVIDIDNASDYETIQQRFLEFCRYDKGNTL